MFLKYSNIYKPDVYSDLLWNWSMATKKDEKQRDYDDFNVVCCWKKAPQSQQLIYIFVLKWYQQTVTHNSLKCALLKEATEKDVLNKCHLLI